MKQNFQTAADIIERLKRADAEEFSVLERSFSADTRKTVQSALRAARRRIEAQGIERERLLRMYSFQTELAGGGVVLGLDEVGRGPVAGPVAVGGVVLPDDVPIEGLNDSKQVPEHDRVCIATQIKDVALAWTVQMVGPEDIDRMGIAACLVLAFKRAISAIEENGIVPDSILLDGNPLRLDPRERNVVKGDAQCASIAAASIVAKVERDALMVELAEKYPGYGFENNKGYASEEHREAIARLGLSPIHRVSFCSAFTQQTLF